ncbi:histidinol phosphatase [Flavobacterium azooxidireducens]|uniref:protein-tyrosine-phosphatase n=1 Tax=Flavobacterium azooxidireducens TaxID=1871076 RepID=A0ABY4KHL7_9FLAO|nr:CpsB/CapC family capsule biosynthesis tyrosine phosphatase [Flavobacterium azooxidireducens]UPQ79273.1 histidinol phosphatase [Flavobacterium azooxidireducens]
MIFFSKKKTILKDLIPDDFVDIHSHLIPGIDDGAKTIKDSLKLIGELEKIGFSQIITTPHVLPFVWNNTKQIIQEGELSLLEVLKSVDNKVYFKAAAEYMLDSSLFEKIKKEKLLTLKDNYLLVEMSYLNPPIQLLDYIYMLQVEGYKPILAHPERYLFYHNNFDAYLQLKKSGCLFQLNLLSTVGYYGKHVAEISDKLLKKELIDFVGSDIHNQRHIDALSGKLIIKEMAPLKEAIHNNQLFRFSI